MVETLSRRTDRGLRVETRWPLLEALTWRTAKISRRWWPIGWEAWTRTETARWWPIASAKLARGVVTTKVWWRESWWREWAIVWRSLWRGAWTRGILTNRAKGQLSSGKGCTEFKFGQRFRSEGRQRKSPHGLRIKNRSVNLHPKYFIMKVDRGFWVKVDIPGWQDHWACSGEATAEGVRLQQS